MSQFHFFTDYDLLLPQTANQSFGPAGTTTISGIVYDKYRVTSLHSASGNPKAYALCDGTICAQVDKVNSTLINIIVKPSQILTFNHVPVKYFIYKGIKLDSLINISNMEISSSSSISLARKVRETQAKWNIAYDKFKGNSPGTTTDKPSHRALGLHYTSSAPQSEKVLDTDSIDKLFIREDLNFQLPNVQAGDSIGEFISSSFGLEILVESDYTIANAELARNKENFILVETLPNGYNDLQFFTHWRKKEVCLGFVDISSFYGNLCLGGISAINSNNALSNFASDEVYSLLLQSFFNKDLIYIDIRNDLGFSFNYFQNYSNFISISLDEGLTYENSNYYQSNWPILIINNLLLSANNLNSFNLKIAIPLPNSTENPSPLLFIEQGYLSTFFPNIPSEMELFIDISNPGNNLSKYFEFSMNKLSGMNNKVFSTYIKAIVFKQNDALLNTVSSGIVQRYSNMQEFAFIFTSLKNYQGNSNYVAIEITPSKMLIEIDDLKYLAKIGIAKDENNFYMFNYPYKYFKKGNSVSEVISFTDSLVYDSGFLTYLNKILNVNGYQSQQLNSSTVSKVVFSATPILPNLDLPNPTLINVVSITSTEFTSIHTLGVPYDPLFPIYLGNNVQIIMVDNDGVEFSEQTKELIGHIIQGSTFISQNTTITNLNTYSDGNS